MRSRTNYSQNPTADGFAADGHRRFAVTGKELYVSTGRGNAVASYRYPKERHASRLPPRGEGMRATQ